jgi:hypothetical protein
MSIVQFLAVMAICVIFVAGTCITIHLLNSTTNEKNKAVKIRTRHYKTIGYIIEYKENFRWKKVYEYYVLKSVPCCCKRIMSFDKINEATEYISIQTLMSINDEMRKNKEDCLKTEKELWVEKIVNESNKYETTIRKY